MARKLKFYDVVDRKSFTTTNWRRVKLKNGRTAAMTTRKGRRIFRIIG